jgi:hypothetical protein
MAHNIKPVPRHKSIIPPKRASVVSRALTLEIDLDGTKPPPRKIRKSNGPSPNAVNSKTTRKFAEKVKSAKLRAEEKKNEAAHVLQTNTELAIMAARKRSSTNGLIESLHADGELSRALEFSEDPKAAQFLADLADPRYSKWTASALASRNGFSPLRITDIFRNHMLANASLEFVKKAPEVSKDVVEDARSTRVSCSRCDGLGYINEEVEEGEKIVHVKHKCPNCRGSGTTRKPGDSDSRKLMYEVIGLAGKRAGGSTTTNITLPSVASMIEEDDLAARPTISITTNG